MKLSKRKRKKKMRRHPSKPKTVLHSVTRLLIMLRKSLLMPMISLKESFSKNRKMPILKMKTLDLYHKTLNIGNSSR